MNVRTYVPLFLGLLVIVAVFGTPLLLASPMHEELGCPFAMGQAAMCLMGILEHVTHWQVAFASILAELLLVAALAFVTSRQWELVALSECNFSRVRMRNRAPDRPTLLQELFSNGIVHPKVF